MRPPPLLATLLLVLAGCGPEPAPPQEARPPTQIHALTPATREEAIAPAPVRPPDTGRVVVVLLDESGSMEQTDPRGFARAGAELLVSLCSPADRVGLVVYAHAATTLVPVEPVGADPARYGRALAARKRAFTTSYEAAFGEAARLLESAQAPPGSLVVLLSDGQPTDRDGEPLDPAALARVKEQVRALGARGWVVDTVGLGAEAHPGLLAGLSAQTMGGYFPAATSRRLLEVFTEIAGEHLGYYVAGSAFDPVPVPAGTTRLAFLAGEGGGLGGALRGDRACDPRRADHALFSTSLLVDPPAGLYRAVPRGAPGFDRTLVDVGLFVQFLPERPSPRVESRTFDVAVRIGARAPGASLPPGLAEGLRVAARAEPVEGGPAAATTVLTLRPLASPDALYEGRLTLPDGFDARSPRGLNVIATVDYGAAGAVLTMSRRVAVSVTAPPAAAPAAVTAEEATRALRAVRKAHAAGLTLRGRYGWVEGTLLLTNTSRVGVTVELAPTLVVDLDGQAALVEGDLLVEPSRISLGAGASQRARVRVFLPGDLARGAYRAALRATAALAGTDVAAAPSTIELPLAIEAAP